MKTSSQVAMIVISAMLGSAVTYVLTSTKHDVKTSSATAKSSNVVAVSNDCEYDVLRQSGYKYIQPVHFVIRAQESDKFQPLKSQLQSVIDSCIQSGLIKRASVFFRDFEEGNWFAVNPDEKYHPGSLMKLPLMLTYFKMAEEHEGLLNREILNDFDPAKQAPQFYTSKKIEYGKRYTIRQLMEYMIRYSDNYATTLLLKNVNKDVYLKLYEDLALDRPNLMDINYTISPREYSMFLTSVYNGSYLTKEYSEYAAELLAGCDFEKGFAAGMPDDTPMAHKFGEWSDGRNIAQLHEAGIIYINGMAYELVVMTDGEKLQQLPAVISSIAGAAYRALDDPRLPDTTFPEENLYSENLKRN